MMRLDPDTVNKFELSWTCDNCGAHGIVAIETNYVTPNLVTPLRHAVLADHNRQCPGCTDPQISSLTGLDQW